MPWLIITSSLIIFLCFLFLFLIFPTTRKHPDRNILKGMYIAHRGLHDNAIPENSISSFSAAIKKGFPIEIDIHLTKDGELVIFHDNDLKRMCGDERLVCELTLAELRSLKLLKTNEKIPTLKECLETVSGNVPLMIEFKVDRNNWKTLCTAANDVLKNYKGKYFIQSFYPQVLYWYRKNRKDICRGQLSSAKMGKEFYKKLCECLLFNFISRPDFVSYEYLYCNNPIRKLVTRLGAFPVGWTFPSQEELDKCKRCFKTYIFENFLPKV